MEEHLVTVFEGSNLTCRHQGICTLAPQDIRLYRRLSGNEDKFGIEPRSQEQREMDWGKFQDGRLSLEEAMVLGTEKS